MQATWHRPSLATCCHFVFIWLFLVIALLPKQVLPAAAQQSSLKVAVFKDIGVGPCFNNLVAVLRRQPDIQMTILAGDDVREGALKRFDIFIVPGGSGKKEAGSLEAFGETEIKRFVADGGCYMGICAGCYLASNATDYLGLLPVGIRDRRHWQRGVATLPIEFTPAGKEVFGVERPMAKIVYHNGPVLDCRPIFENPQPAETLVPLAFFRDEIVAANGERGVMKDAPAMVLAKYGKGLVLGLSPHPELTPPLNRIIPHALHWLADHVKTQSLPAALAATVPVNPEAKTGIKQQAQAVQIADKRQATAKEQGDKAGGTPALPGDQPASTVSAKAFEVARSVFEKADVVAYEHRQRPAADQIVQESNGDFDARTDCSGFISYVVHAVAPKHYRAVHSMQPRARYPQAKTWAHFFAQLDAHEPNDGWLRILRYEDLREGDIIAWVKAKTATDHAGGGNTGHVMMVAGHPSEAQHETLEGQPITFVSIPVIDSSSVYHFQPEQLPPLAHQGNRNGLGQGSVRVILSPDDKPIGYWEGTYWGEGQKPVAGPKLSPDVRFARMVSLVDR